MNIGKDGSVSTRMSIGKDGAVFSVPYLGVTVDFPEDCLKFPVELQLSEVSPSDSSIKFDPHEDLISRIILLRPEDKSFDKPAKLKILHRVYNQELYPYTEIKIKQFNKVTKEWMELSTKCSREIQGQWIFHLFNSKCRV